MRNKVIMAGMFGAMVGANAAYAVGEGVLATEAFVRDAYAQGKTYAAGQATAAETNAKAYTDTAISGVTAGSFSGNFNDLTNKPVLGTAAATAATDYATAAQGTKADTAVQPAAIVDMETQTHATATYATQTALAAKQDLLPTAAGNDGKILGVTDAAGTIGWVDNNASPALNGADRQVLMGDTADGYKWAAISSDTFVE